MMDNRRLMRERPKDHPWHGACVASCERDVSSFDSGYATRPLAHFGPLLRRIVSREAYDPRSVAAGS